MDETTGIYHKQEDYEKTNALFTLPLDTSKADETAAESYIQNLMKENESEEQQTIEQIQEAQENTNNVEKK